MLLAVAAGSIGLAAAPTVALGQSPAPAISAPLQERHGSGVTGSVRLTPEGKATSVTVTFKAAPITNESLRLISGADCNDMRGSSPAIPLNSISGRTSQTIVNVPLSAFRSHHFVVDVRNATARAQRAEACARL